MTIVSNQSLVPAAAAPATRPAALSDLQRQSWQQEFERARWQAQPRYQTAPVSDAAALPGAGADQGSSAAAPNEMRTELPDGANERLASSRTIITDTADASGTPDAHRPIVAPRETDAASPALVSARTTQSSAAMNGTAHAAPASLALQADPTWSATSPWLQRLVHVHAGEHATTVWIRDARLQPGDASQILDTLEAGRSELPDSGKPIALMLNGQPVRRGPRSP